MTDYMATDAEMEKQPDALRFMREVAGEDKYVFDALWSFWNFAHAFDDLVDNSILPLERKEQVFKALHDFTRAVMLNPFVQANAPSIFALFVSAMTRCLDGDKFERSEDPKERALAPAVRCGDIDVLMHIAYLHRGWDTLRSYSTLRKYDTEKG